MVVYASEIRKAIDEMDVDRARLLVRDAMKAEPTAEVYYLASKVALDHDQRISFLEKALKEDPFYEDANRALKQLQPAQASAVNGTSAYGMPSTGSASDQLIVGSNKAIQIDKTYELASPGNRLVAWFIDRLIIVIPLVVLFFGLLYFDPGRGWNEQEARLNATSMLTGFLFIVFQIGYPAYFLSQRDGQTLGKLLMGIKVVKLDGERITAIEGFVRDAIGYWFSSLFFSLGYLWILLDGKQQGWHDKFVNTVVVKAR